MKAFLLSAGLGTRLRPLTNDLPKCLLPIGGKPLLEIWLELLGLYGVSEVLVNTHWHAEKVENYIKDRSQKTEIGDQKSEVRERQRSEVTPVEHPLYHLPELQGGLKEPGSTGQGGQKKVEKEKIKEKPNIKLFYEKELLGSAGTVLVNREWVANGQPFFILYGDNLTNVDLGRMYEFHLDHGMPFTLGVFRADEPERCGIADVDKDWVVTGFVEKPERPRSDLAAAGIYVADQRIFEFFPEGAEGMRPLDLGFHVIPRMVGRMKAYFIEEFLMDIGTVESYEKAQMIWSRLDISRKGAKAFLD